MLSARSFQSVKSLAVGLVAILAFGLTAQAQSFKRPTIFTGVFTGSINFVGNATLNAPLGSASGFTSISGFISGGQTGGFSIAPDYTPVTFTPFTFNPGPLAPFPLLNFTVIPFIQPTFGDNRKYSFEVTSISPSSSQTGSALNLVGSGYILESDYSIFADFLSYSPATWSLNVLGVSETGRNMVTYEASINSVPEPGAFSLLLVAGLLLGGWMFVRRAQPKL